MYEARAKSGFPESEEKKHDFHGWRHFFTTYLMSKLEKKLLKSQTGHRTDIMLARYGEHWKDGDRELIQRAQTETFGKLIPS